MTRDWLNEGARWGVSFKFHQDIEGICECIAATEADLKWFWMEHTDDST